MKIYELRVEVLGEGVWRRLEVPAEMTLAGLHLTLQRAMGWTNSGLYAFETDDARYGVLNHEDEWMRDPRATDVRVRKIGELAARADRIDYVYEGARSWRHAILVEGASTAHPDARYPRVIGGDGPTVMEALEPGSWREPSDEALPSFDQIRRQASADAGFDSIARLLEPLGSAPLLPEVVTAPAPSPPEPRRLAAPPHVIRPPELMAACSARLGGVYPEQGLDAFIFEVAERDLIGVHDMFTRKVVEDMLRRELGPPPEPPEPEPELEAELEAEAEAEPDVEQEPEAVEAAANAPATSPLEAAPTDGSEAEDEPSADAKLVEAHAPIETRVLEPVVGVGGAVGVQLADLEELLGGRLGDGAQLEPGEVQAEALGELDELEPTTGMKAADEVEELSAWEEESWSLSEPEPSTSLGDVDELSREAVALGALPSWGGHQDENAPLWDASLDELGALSATGFEPAAHDSPEAGIEMEAPEDEAFEAAPEKDRESFEAAHDEAAVEAFEVEPGLKALPRSRRLSGCLERIPATWLDEVAEHLEVDEPRRDVRAREISERLVRVEVLAELVASELSVEAIELARELAEQDDARGVAWCVDGAHVDEDLSWFTFAHPGALGQLRRCGLVFVGVSGARAELEVVVPVELRRPLQIVLR